MATGTVRVSDVIVPAVFSQYVQQLTQQKTRIIQSGVAPVDNALNMVLMGGGLTFNEPSWRDLDPDIENQSSDDPSVAATPFKIQTSVETQVRLSRNAFWETADLTAALAGSDPAAAIANRVSYYWQRRMQDVFIATMRGILADNAAAPTGADTHLQNDLSFDISGASFVSGTTNFSASAFIKACLTAGDSMDEFSMVMMHSVVYATAKVNNLIEFIPDSTNEAAAQIPTFLGKRVIVDDSIPNASGVFDTWIFRPNSFRVGMGTPKVPTEIDRKPELGNGAGVERLFNRVEWIMHPVGHAYIGTPPIGGPTNANTANNLANAGSWRRVFPERKQIGIARLITREF